MELHNMTVEQLQKRAAELKKQEFKKVHPVMGFLADERGCNIVSDADLAKSVEAGAALRKAFGRGESTAETALPADYDAAVELFMAAEFGSSEQLRLAKHIQKLLRPRS